MTTIANTAPPATSAVRRAPPLSPVTASATAAPPSISGAAKTPACRLDQTTTAPRNQSAVRSAEAPPASNAPMTHNVTASPSSENTCGRSTKRSRPTKAAAARASVLASAPAPRRRQAP